MAEYQAIVDIVYNISDKQKEKLKNVDGRNTIVIDAESNFSKVEKDVAELKKEFNSLKTIFKSFGKDSGFEDVDKQISSAALKLNNLSKAVQDIQQGGRKNAVIDINISELNKIIDFANTFESTYKNTFDEVKKRCVQRQKMSNKAGQFEQD